ncbi:MAG: hypothetical protein QXW09_01865 [Thermoproteota archaeon]
MLGLSEYDERIRRIIPIIALVSVVVVAVILLFFLALNVLAPQPSIVDFRLELNRTRVEVFQGKVVSTLITLKPEGSFQGDVTLEVKKPSNMSLTLSKWVLNPSSNTAVLKLNTSGVAPGLYRINISGSYSEVQRKVVLTIIVREAEKPWFEARVNIQPNSIMQAEMFNLNFSITPHAGFNDTISIVLDGLPGASLERSVIEKGINKTIVGVYTSRNTPAGVNNFTVVLNSTSYTASFNLTIEVSEAPPASFQISFSPNITLVKPGDTVNIFISVKPFYGFDEAIHVYSSHTGLSLKKFNGSSFVLTPRNYTGVLVSMVTDRDLAYGIYYLTFGVNTSSTIDFKVVKIGIANVSFTFKKSVPSILIPSPRVDAFPGDEVTLNVLIGSLNGFKGEVIPRVIGPSIGRFYFSTGEGFPQMGISIERVNITAGEAKFLFLRVMINRDVPRGIYRVDVELCIEYTPPNMAYPVLNATSVYTLEFHIG